MVEFDPNRSEPLFQLLIPDTQGTEGVWIPWELGASSAHVAVGGAVNEMGWRQAPPGGAVGVSGKESYEVVFDIDVRGDQLLVLGLKRDAQQRLAAKGELAWLGRLGRGFEGVRPVHYSADGPGARNADACLHMDFGVVRFLPSGGFVILPQFEEGAFLYDDNGVLQRTWSSKEVGYTPGCPLSDKERDDLSVDEPARWRWVNQRRVVDDVLPLAEGPGVLLRMVSEERVEWQMALLRRDGHVDYCRVPFVANAPNAHMRGDVGPDGVVLLVQVLHQRGTEPAMEPRVLFAKGSSGFP